ncbi:tRNA(5-methylaminomethyl-2-thiouridylate) methyltransferase [Desulfovibrio sp. OttesenSCG-928-I05]|nr:tRNA(5-methylaminomethyl-2-thiouridylate) methyltransferase [Desulfovibrio sp. OttesenSCG-928-I05]
MQYGTQYDAVALLSGGLDSILAARLVQDMGRSVLCLHFYSPFFDQAADVARWKELYGLTVLPVDVGEDFAELLTRRPEHGFGKVLNPCVDCKIIMLRKAEAIRREVGARVIITGEVLGQRPMSQRRDTLHVIQREAGVKGVLLRPLSALHMEPTEAEESGFIDRTKLLGIHGRGRKEQLALAEQLELREIPTPAGGCLLAERENARSFWPVLAYSSSTKADDFKLAGSGRQYWNRVLPDTPLWLCVGRNQADNDALMALSRPTDLLFKVRDFPGPVALGRQFDGAPWDADAVLSAAAFMASFSPKACKAMGESGEALFVRVHSGDDGLDSPGYQVRTMPERSDSWREFSWDEAKEAIRAERRQAQ